MESKMSGTRSRRNLSDNQGQDCGGVSRSGRVRRKSSKLTDFESPDEVEAGTKKKVSPTKGPVKPTKLQASSSSSSGSSSSSDSDSSDLEGNVKNGSLKYMDGWNEAVNPEDLLDLKDDDYDDYDDQLHVDDYSSRDDSNFNQAQSLYFSEKKKMNIKESLNTKQKKAERKDKGHSRMTAYMLWAKATRPSIVESNPNMDFSSVNRRLGEMWALVPQAQKMSWSRKARQILARSEKGKKGKSMISTGKPKKTPSEKPNHLKKGPIQQFYRVVSKSETKQQQQLQQQQATANARKLPYQTPKNPRQTSTPTNDSGSPPTSFKVTGTAPIDVSAHLKLLGESLNNIGQKLKEHEGQIAVSGSLSVLLDSMLCVLGPLICLTNQLDETRGAIHEQTLNRILDNIAYIMPGIF